MLTALLRTGSVWLVVLLLGLLPAAATHLVGGELTYKYLNSTSAGTSYNYEITAQVYFNKEVGSSAPNGTTTVTIAIYSKAPGGALLSRIIVARRSFSEITQSVQPGCSLQVPRVTLAQYRTNVNLPAVSAGYLAVFSLGNRNDGITNLDNSLGEPMTLSVDMTPGTIINSSPAFSDKAFVLVCLGDTSTILNNAYDADGDRLSYSFGTPFSASVSQPVRYTPGYSAAQPFGATGYATVDARTGVARYLCFTQGTFLVAVDVREYRTINGQEVLLGTLRRDIQIVVRACAGPPNLPPAFAIPTLAQRDFQVEEGQTVGFNITAADPDAQSLRLTVSSVLLDGPGPIDATLNGQPGNGSSTNPVGSVSLKAMGSVTGAFRLKAGCGQARPIPYDVVATVTDSTCNSKTVAAVFRITVTRPAFAARIQGDSVHCAQSEAAYTVTNSALSEYRWTVRGGQVQGSATGRTVAVRWTTPGTGTVTVRGLTPVGCLTDSVSRAVVVQPSPVVTGPAVYCLAANTGLRYTVEGPPVAYEWSIANGTIVSGQGTNEVVIDIAKGSTATLQAANAALTPCVTSLRIGPDDSCLAFFNIITPNGDGQNDIFIIQNIERHPNSALTIFNRWGRQVYQSANYQNTYSGEGAGPGLYYYLCQLPDGPVYKGWFEVVR